MKWLSFIEKRTSLSCLMDWFNNLPWLNLLTVITRLWKEDRHNVRPLAASHQTHHNESPPLSIVTEVVPWHVSRVTWSISDRKRQIDTHTHAHTVIQTRTPQIATLIMTRRRQGSVFGTLVCGGLLVPVVSRVVSHRGWWHSLIMGVDGEGVWICVVGGLRLSHCEPEI